MKLLLSTILYVVMIGKIYADAFIDLKKDQQVTQQINGEYGHFKRKESLPLGAFQKAWDTANVSDAVYTVIWNPKEVIKLRTREFMKSTLVLPKWETIQKISIGDKSIIKSNIIQHNIVVLTPQKFIGADTNITILGHSGLIYTFYIRNEGYNSTNIPDLIVYIKAAKPIDFDTSNKIFSENDGEIESKYSPASINFQYSMSGSKEIAPDWIFSDGEKIWMNYNNMPRHFPAIFSIENKTLIPLEVYRSGKKLSVSSLGPIVLKHGNQITCIKASKG